MSKINPGPWAVEAPKQIDIPISAVGLYGERVIVARVPFGSKVDAEAHARLVAAAPDLLDALQTAVSTQPADSPIKWVLWARAAIAKATGETA